LSHKLEVGEQRSLASHYTLTTAVLSVIARWWERTRWWWNRASIRVVTALCRETSTL